MKTVSVIVPAYNAEQYIQKTITSICEQTYPHLEIIIVNDGSTDSTPAIIDAAAAKDARIVAIHKENGGVSSARNAGLAAATGDYICWLDSDDWMEPAMISTLLEVIEKDGADIALCNYYNISAKSGKMLRYDLKGKRIFTSEEALHALIKKEITQALWSSVAKRSLYEGITFPEGRIFEDVLEMHRVYGRCGKIVLIEDILMNRMVRSNSISNELKIVKRIESSEAYLERQTEIRKTHPEWEKDFVCSNIETLKLLRSAVIRSSAKHCRAQKARIRPVMRYFREHTDMYPGKDARLGAKLEYRLLTTGSYLGMVLSVAVGHLAKKNTFLK